MKKIPKISEAEWEIMKVLWAKEPATAEEIIQALTAAGSNWHPKTTRSLLNRLIKKKALGFKKDGRTYLYTPLVAQADCVQAESDSFLGRVFGGALQPMIAHFVENQKLSPEEVEELKRLLEGKK